MNYNIEFAYAVINNVNNSKTLFINDLESLMQNHNLQIDAKEKLRSISAAMSANNQTLVEQGWSEFTQQFIGPELGSVMRW